MNESVCFFGTVAKRGCAMSLSYEGLLKDFSCCEGASNAAIDNAIQEVGLALPVGYRDFLTAHNGGEGFVGESYLIIWAAEEVAQFNKEYQVSEYAPGLLLFGSDGSGEGYAFDYREQPPSIVRVPFIGMGLKYAKPIAETFPSFFSVLALQHDD